MALLTWFRGPSRLPGTDVWTVDLSDFAVVGSLCSSVRILNSTVPFCFFHSTPSRSPSPPTDATAWTQGCHVLWWTTFLPVLHGHTWTACPHPSTFLLLFLSLALVGRWVGQGTPSVCWETQATRPSISHSRPNPPGETWDDPTAPSPLRSSSTPTPTARVLLASCGGARNVYRRGPDGGLGSPRFGLGGRPR